MEIEEKQNVIIVGKKMHGGGITQLKQHLTSGKHSGVSRRKLVPPLIRKQMSDHLVEKEAGKKTKINRDATLKETTLQGSQGYVDVDTNDDDDRLQYLSNYKTDV